MPIKQRSFDEEVGDRIRSMYRTLDRYRRTSMVSHGRLVPSVKTYATLRQLEVQAIGSKWPDSELVQKWVRKFDEYVTYHNLIEESVD